MLQVMHTRRRGAIDTRRTNSMLPLTLEHWLVTKLGVSNQNLHLSIRDVIIIIVDKNRSI